MQAVQAALGQIAAAGTAKVGARFDHGRAESLGLRLGRALRARFVAGRRTFDQLIDIGKGWNARRGRRSGGDLGPG
jgi:hypothetical protein